MIKLSKSYQTQIYMKSFKRFWHFAVLSALILGICPIKANGQDTLRLSLNQALEIALSENPTIKVANQEIEKKEYAKKGTYASLFPQIDLGGDYQRNVKKQVMYMNTGAETSAGIEIGMNNSWSGGVSAGMPLVSATLWKSLALSAMDVELAVEQARSSKIDMIEQVSKAFYGVLLAADSYTVFKETYDNAVENYKTVKKKFDLGLTSEYDMIRANVSVKNAEPNMYNAENSLVLAHWQLKALLGVDLEMNISCQGTLTDYESDLQRTYRPNDLSIDENSDLKQLYIQERLLSKTLEMKKAANLPSLDLSFSYMWNSMNDNFKFSNYKWNPYSIAGFSLSVPIFAGGKRQSDINQAKVNLSQLKLQREDAERGLRVSTMQYISSMQTCTKQYAAAQSSIDEAERGYSIAVKRYETGKGTLLEINDSQLALTQARLNLNQSIYDYMTAKLSLEKVLGKYENQK